MILEPVKVYTNTKVGVSSYVSNSRNETFSVTLRDDRSGEMLFFRMYYKSLEEACEKAREVIEPMTNTGLPFWVPVW